MNLAVGLKKQTAVALDNPVSRRMLWEQRLGMLDCIKSKGEKALGKFPFSNMLTAEIPLLVSFWERY